MKQSKLSTRAQTVLKREFGGVLSRADVVPALRAHRFGSEWGWSPLKVLFALRGVGPKTRDEIARYARLKEQP